MKQQEVKVGLFFPTFNGGGAERMMVNLAKGLHKQGISVVIYVVNNVGPYIEEVPVGVEIISYNAKRGVKSVIHKIRKTLKHDGLTDLISTPMHLNAAVGMASIGLKTKPNLIFREANTPSKALEGKLSQLFYSSVYTLADKYVAVSEGVKVDMVEFFKLSKEKVSVVYNPVVDDDIFVKMAEEIPENTWFQDSATAVILGIGSFTPQKGFEDLIDAFLLTRAKYNCRLVILGDKKVGSSYFEFIKDKIDKSDYREDILLPGFVNNPFKYLSNADVFVLSSKYEGLPGVLIQALACGCSVVSTDCPSGPREVLNNGEFGALVEVGNVKALSDELCKVLKSPNNNKEYLQKRALEFSVKNSVKGYIDLFVGVSQNSSSL